MTGFHRCMNELSEEAEVDLKDGLNSQSTAYRMGLDANADSGQPTSITNNGNILFYLTEKHRH